MNSTSKWSARIPELDGIRGTAIAMVLVWHYFRLGIAMAPAPASFLSRSLVPLRLMWTGVDLFFVLSGFLIGGILLDARESTNYFQVFYIRRFFRIVPIYAAILLILPTLLLVMRAAHHADYSWLTENSLPWYPFWTFTQNFWMAAANTLGANIIGITWSLAIEEQFYLTLPLIIRFFSGRRLLILVLSGICLAPILRTAILFTSPNSWAAAFVLMPCRADALLFGALAAILLRKEKCFELFKSSTRWFGVLCSVFLCGLVFLIIKSPGVFSPAMQTIGYTWIAFFYAIVLVFVLTHRESFLSEIFRNAILRWLGMLAYCTYLIHQAVQGFVFAAIWGQPPEINSVYTLLGSLSSLAVTLSIASLSWRYFELPLIRYGPHLNYRLVERCSTILVTGRTE
jgi:peptidoglycan/LPS O-acetylase OafA/YrhL